MYEIKFEGIRLDADRADALRRLGALFHASEAQLAALLARVPVSIKNGLDEAASERYVRLIEAAGGKCRAEPERLEVDLPEGAEPVHVDTAGDQVAAPEPAPSPMSPLVPAFAASISQLDSSTIKRSFFLHYVVMFEAGNPAPRNGYEDARSFSPAMGELAFWGRCLFYPDDPWVEARLDRVDAAALQKESGRILESQVKRIFDTLESRDADEVHTLMNLMAERYSLHQDRDLLKLMTATATGRADDRAITNARSRLEAVLRQLSSTPGTAAQGATRASATPVASLDSDEGPDFGALVSAPRVAVLVICGGLAWLLGSILDELWLPAWIMASGIAAAYLLWCYEEQDAGRLVVFWNPADAMLTAGGAVLAGVILLVSLFSANWHWWLLGIAAVLLFATFVTSFQVSASSNASRNGVLASAVAKLSLLVLALAALFLLFARAVSKPDKRGDEGELAYQRRVDDHDRSVTLQSVATSAGMVAAGWLFTRNLSNDAPPPYQLDKARETLAIHLAVGALAVLALLYHQDDLATQARRLVLGERTAPVSRGDLDADHALRDYQVHHPQRLADSWTHSEFDLDGATYRTYFISVPRADTNGRPETCNACAPAIGAITYVRDGKRWKVTRAQAPAGQLGQGGKPPDAVRAAEMRLGAAPALRVSSEHGGMGVAIGLETLLAFVAGEWRIVAHLPIKEDNTQGACEASTCVRWSGKLRIGEVSGAPLPPLFVDAQGAYAPQGQAVIRFAESFRYEFDGKEYQARTVTPWERDAKVAAKAEPLSGAIPVAAVPPAPAPTEVSTQAQPAPPVPPSATTGAIQRVADGNYPGMLTCGQHLLAAERPGWTEKLQAEVRAGSLAWVRARTDMPSSGSRPYSERATGRLGPDGAATIRGQGSYMDDPAHPWTVTARVEVRGDAVTGPLELMGSDGRKVRDCTVTIRLKGAQ